MLVEFLFEVESYRGFSMTLNLLMRGRSGRWIAVNNPQSASYILNKYARRVTFGENCFSFTADVLDSAVPALEYAALASREPTHSEIDRMVADGTTLIHEFLKAVGFSVEDTVEAFNRLIEGGGLTLNLNSFPKIKMTAGDEDGWLNPITFNAEDADTSILRRWLAGGATEEEKMMMRGVSLFVSEKTLKKYSALLVGGKLALERLAKALAQSISREEKRARWNMVVKWLYEGGFEKLAADAIIKRTMLK